MIMLFHVSPHGRLSQVEPNKSLSAIPRVWLCDESTLHWALTHIAIHHRVTVWDLFIYPVRSHYKSKCKRMRPGIYTSELPIRVQRPFRFHDLS